ncbi:unnamed protein product [Paramecium octaurelia]|uniref:Uncharacterized protein n=1 Tax=Paramecium octaurelia TaxID=43137 RepID=A0A8S1YLS9_PAROT|nr:unnamed protein product [Paramecium octaurelia]
MSAKELPPGGCNKGVVIPLVFSCPQECICKSNVPKKWYHKQCGKPLFVSEYGYILCENHLKDCSAFFIKDAFFQCNEAKKNNSWYKYRNLSNMLMALSNIVQAAELKEEEGLNIQSFTKNLLDELNKKWNS